MRFPTPANAKRLLTGLALCAAICGAISARGSAEPLADRQAQRTEAVRPDSDDYCNPNPLVVYSWRDLPQNQHICIRRVFFDEGGYQLYDQAGNVIVVPFCDQELYVLKFCLATDNTISVVNQGNYPVLYLPISARLKNATVPKAYWYPLSAQFHPSAPVFLSMAPNYDAYMSMGWFPGMIFWGGYWSGLAFHPGNMLVPTTDMHVLIEERRCSGWQPYRDYCAAHTPPFFMAYLNPGIYNRSDGG
jgi:hypothetical protein